VQPEDKGASQAADSLSLGRNSQAAFQAALACRGLDEIERASEYYRQAVELEPSLGWTSLLSQELRIQKK